MTKRLIDKAREATPLPRVQFVPLWPEIKIALDARVPAKAIWKTLRDEGQFSGRYETFTRLIKDQRKTETTAPGATDSPRPKPQATGSKTFAHDPEGTIDPSDISD